MLRLRPRSVHDLKPMLQLVQVSKKSAVSVSSDPIRSPSWQRVGRFVARFTDGVCHRNRLWFPSFAPSQNTSEMVPSFARMVIPL